MLQATVIGNLGADAREESYNGNKFLSFSVAHKETWTGQDGMHHENTVWVSCTLNGDGGNLRQFLIKGKCVFVQGRLSTRVYSSPKERKMVAGINIAVDRIELIGGRVDEVPSRLYTENGEQLDVHKAFFIATEKAKAMGAEKGKPVYLQKMDGSKFQVDNNGWVVPVVATSQTNNTTMNEQQQQQTQETDGVPF